MFVKKKKNQVSKAHTQNFDKQATTEFAWPKFKCNPLYGTQKRYQTY
jgi:hypothetical protein